MGNWKDTREAVASYIEEGSRRGGCGDVSVRGMRGRRRRSTGTGESGCGDGCCVRDEWCAGKATRQHALHRRHRADLLEILIGTLEVLEGHRMHLRKDVEGVVPKIDVAVEHPEFLAYLLCEKDVIVALVLLPTHEDALEPHEMENRGHPIIMCVEQIPHRLARFMPILCHGTLIPHCSCTFLFAIVVWGCLGVLCVCEFSLVVYCVAFCMMRCGCGVRGGGCARIEILPNEIARYMASVNALAPDSKSPDLLRNACKLASDNNGGKIM